MLTYTLEKRNRESLYEQLYRCIREDILSGRLRSGERLPSKRTLAQHLEVSIITVKNAYEQLLAEGYIHARQRCGYFVSEVERPPEIRQPAHSMCAQPEKEQGWFLDFASGAMDPAYFPFTVWARLMRQTILEQDKGLLRAAPYNGAAELRVAIAGYLRQFRGMRVDPEQIIVGAGTELLYHMIIELLGRDKCYAVEDPGYSKIAAIYESNRVQVQYVGIDEAGLSVSELRRHTAQVVHISPTHHYPTGTVMPIGRRQELLRWAAEKPDRYILEDDYDSEFRFVGRPIPSLYSTDENQRAVYLNTFSQTLEPNGRVWGIMSSVICILLAVIVVRKQEKAYSLLIKLIEEYNIKLLSTKIYWDKPSDREEYKEFWKKYQKISELKGINNAEYNEQIEILFITNDLKKVYANENKYYKIIKFYKNKLVELGAMRNLKNSFTSNIKLYSKAGTLCKR